jgi:O-antigen/teichoic acid export membrane protein
MRVALDEGGATLAINLAYLAALRLDVLILARTCPIAALAGYAVGSRAVDQSFVVAKQTSAAMLGRLWRPGERARRTIEGTWMIGATVAAGMAALMHDGRPLLRAWVGPSADAAGAASALLWLGIAATFAGTSEIACATRTLTSKSAWSAALPIVVGSAVNVALSLALVGPIGASGVAAATAVGNAVVAIWTWRALRSEGVLDVREVALALAPVGVIALVSHAIAWSLRSFASAGLAHSIAACAVAMGLPLFTALALSRSKRAQSKQAQSKQTQSKQAQSERDAALALEAT